MNDQPSVARVDDPNAPADLSPLRVGQLITALRARLLQGIDAELSPYDLTASQFPVLRHIADGTGATAAELCRCLSYDTGSMTRMLDRLADKGLIMRVRNPDDRRAVQLRLSPLGQEMFPKLIEIAEQVMARHLAGFTPEDIEQFQRFILRMLANSRSGCDKAS
jgi:MarR family multiple antibiotic resistance transcriptional regulator